MAAELAAQLETAKADAKSKPEAAAAAKEAAKVAETRKAATAKAATEAKLALEPVSIYISRATQKLYVRRNTHKPAPDGGGEVFDASIEVPVTIRDPGRRIGTHVFTAVARNDEGLRWTAVTIDGANDAKEALDRITIPQDVLDRIAPTALPRSSIIISDEPLSAETNYRTEFVAVLSDHPQGGFITRTPTPPDVSVAGYEGDDRFGSFFQRAGAPRPAILPSVAGVPNWSPARLGPATCQSGLVRRPVSPGATGLVTGRGRCVDVRDHASTVAQRHSRRRAMPTRSRKDVIKFLAPPLLTVVSDLEPFARILVLKVP